MIIESSCSEQEQHKSEMDGLNELCEWSMHLIALMCSLNPPLVIVYDMYNPIINQYHISLRKQHEIPT